jgi:hypothetical protein
VSRPTILFLTIGIYRTAQIRKKLRAKAAEAAAGA